MVEQTDSGMVPLGSGNLINYMGKEVPVGPKGVASPKYPGTTSSAIVYTVVLLSQFHSYSNRTGAGYCTNTGSVVNNVMPSVIACDTKMRSNGSL